MSPGDGGDVGDGVDGDDGRPETSSSVSDSLGGRWDEDCWTYGWAFDETSEEIVVENPDTSTDLHVLVDSYRGGGDYTLTIAERSA